MKLCKYLSIHALREKDLSLCSISPVLEGVVHDGFQHQPVTDVRRATKMEHVYAPKGWVSVTQAAELWGGQERKASGCLWDVVVLSHSMLNVAS